MKALNVLIIALFSSQAVNAGDMVCYDHEITQKLTLWQQAKLSYYNLLSNDKKNHKELRDVTNDPNLTSCFSEIQYSVAGPEIDMKKAQQYLDKIESIQSFDDDAFVNYDEIFANLRQRGQLSFTQELIGKINTTKAYTQVAAMLIRADDFVNARFALAKADRRSPDLYKLTTKESSPSQIVKRFDFLVSQQIPLTMGSVNALHVLAKSVNSVAGIDVVWAHLVALGVNPNLLFHRDEFEKDTAVNILLDSLVRGRDSNSLDFSLSRQSALNILRAEAKAGRLRNYMNEYSNLFTFTRAAILDDPEFIKPFDTMRTPYLSADGNFNALAAASSNRNVVEYVLSQILRMPTEQQIRVFKDKPYASLSAAIQLEKPELLQKLIDMGIDPNTKTYMGSQFICGTIYNHDIKSTEKLLANGVDVNAVCDYGDINPWAQLNRYLTYSNGVSGDTYGAMAELLLKAGADPAKSTIKSPEVYSGEQFADQKMRDLLAAVRSGLSNKELLQKLTLINSLKYTASSIEQTLNVNGIEMTLNRQRMTEAQLDFAEKLRLSNGEPNVKQVAESLLRRHFDYDRSANDKMKFADVASIFDKASTRLNSGFEVKTALDELINSKGRTGVYNIDATNIMDIITQNRMQCYSGTYAFLVLLNTTPKTNWLNQNNRAVVIFRSGHVLPGFMTKSNIGWILTGYETTVEGNGLVNFGRATNLPKDLVVVDAKDFEIAEIFKDAFTSSDSVRSQMIERARRDFDLSAPDVNYAQSGYGYGGLNSTLFSFGVPDVPQGDLKRVQANVVAPHQMPKTMVVIPKPKKTVAKGNAGPGAMVYGENPFIYDQLAFQQLIKFLDDEIPELGFSQNDDQSFSFPELKVRNPSNFLDKRLYYDIKTHSLRVDRVTQNYKCPLQNLEKVGKEISLVGTFTPRIVLVFSETNVLIDSCIEK
jgi:hypothetical protein